MSATEQLKPELFVLAGVNGAGKSSIGGFLLDRQGVAWFNPDSAARSLVRECGLAQGEANAQAWQLGRGLLEEAIRDRSPHAFETTLGGNTIPALILQATCSHAVRVWFCGLASPEMHIARVKARVAAGGHAIPESKIRERCVSSIENLIGLMPYLAELKVFDNSTEAGADGVVPDPVLVLHMRDGDVLWPTALSEQARTPEWAMPIVQAAFGDPEPGAG